MNITLETERLILRELQLSDAEAFFAMDRNPNVHQYLWNKPVQKIEKINEIIDSIRKQYVENGIGRFAIISKDTNEFIGWAGLKYNTEEVNNKVNFYDIGYRLDEKFWGKGYASEATFAWLNYAFKTMNIKTMEAAAHTENIASNRILQKIGMQMTEQYLEDGISWNWYELENNL
ncbi:GNAT family N-acetyltransferase [Flavobacterium franklandianum]|uniref:GNAT family N-acetyltransferase n=1 Tax=Flavobacterium franklandianum TaxID=2594430 RepID=A0A553C6Y6_9FLAO|nr:GNAT family N-acetyltransferase [Flavobacterium franklandianum]TRX16203.1 GNAT family N-acetyltransferase [Flavobacterium franklandianum]TRX29735.1 GNAT family N-acetyltransferase [Flavobacterium franklandianum]